MIGNAQILTTKSKSIAHTTELDRVESAHQLLKIPSAVYLDSTLTFKLNDFSIKFDNVEFFKHFNNKYKSNLISTEMLNEVSALQNYKSLINLQVIELPLTKISASWDESY